jgi:hypothetical protein
LLHEEHGRSESITMAHATNANTGASSSSAAAATATLTARPMASWKRGQRSGARTRSPGSSDSIAIRPEIRS